MEINTIKKGSAAELLVGSDLLSEGYDVYLPVSKSIGADIIAIKNNIVIRIEVRTGHIQTLKSSDEQVLKFQKNKQSNLLCFDIYAVVCEKKITYIPSLSEVISSTQFLLTNKIHNSTEENISEFSNILFSTDLSKSLASIVSRNQSIKDQRVKEAYYAEIKSSHSLKIGFSAEELNVIRAIAEDLNITTKQALSVIFRIGLDTVITNACPEQDLTSVNN